MPPGCRHFLGTPEASKRFKAYGVDPLDAPENSHKVRGLMNRLSRRMDAELPWSAEDTTTLERGENPRIPSGYTYLLQFVAHDLVHSAIPLSVAGSLGADTANARRAALRLETLYGRGPLSSPFVSALDATKNARREALMLETMFGRGPVGWPFVYAQDAPNDERRITLRLGRIRWKDKAF